MILTALKCVSVRKTESGALVADFEGQTVERDCFHGSVLWSVESTPQKLQIFIDNPAAEGMAIPGHGYVVQLIDTAEFGKASQAAIAMLPPKNAQS